MNIVLTCYLTQKPDPQRGITCQNDDSAVVKTWIESLTRCGWGGIIFHDNLSEAFCEEWASVNVMFQQVGWHTRWTAAEERVRIYLDWLRDNPCEKVLTTDLFDVEFYRNPFEIMTDPNMLYIGSEPLLIGNSQWMKTRMMETYGEVTDADKPILNPGICGGSRNAMIDFLCRWRDEMYRAIVPTLPPHDIVAFNRLIYREKVKYATGHPLHTAFRSNEGPDSGAAIRHK